MYLKITTIDNVDAGVSLNSYSKCSKQDDNKHTEGWLVKTKFNMPSSLTFALITITTGL